MQFLHARNIFLLFISLTVIFEYFALCEKWPVHFSVMLLVELHPIPMHVIDDRHVHGRVPNPNLYFSFDSNGIFTHQVIFRNMSYYHVHCIGKNK